MNSFGEKEAWAYPGTAQFWGIPPIISGTAKAAIFKFCTHIYRLNRNKSPLKKVWCEFGKEVWCGTHHTSFKEVWCELGEGCHLWATVGLQIKQQRAI